MITDAHLGWKLTRVLDYSKEIEEPWPGVSKLITGLYKGMPVSVIISATYSIEQVPKDGVLAYFGRVRVESEELETGNLIAIGKKEYCLMF